MADGEVVVDKVLPRGINGLKCLAVASVYATHMHYVPLNLRTQAISSVSHFFFYSGLLAWLSLKTPLSQTSLFRRPEKTPRTVARFFTRDLWITWIVFMLKRCIVMAIFYHIWHYLVVIHSPSWNPANWLPERRLFRHYWTHFWSHPVGRQLSGSPHLWFLSVVSFFWMLTPPVASILYPLPDVVVIFLALVMTIYSAFAIKVVPDNTVEWTVYYFSPQTHWVAYVLGVLVWRARDCPTVVKLFEAPWWYKKNFITRFIFPISVDASCCFFAYWNWHVIAYKTRTTDDFIDPLYRTTTILAIIVTLWSTPIADYSMAFRFANARYWDRVAPAGVKLAIYVTQWSWGYIVISAMKSLAGRIALLVIVFLTSITVEAILMRPLRDFLTPWYNALQEYAYDTKPLESKESSISMSKLISIADP